MDKIIHLEKSPLLESRLSELLGEMQPHSNSSGLPHLVRNFMPLGIITDRRSLSNAFQRRQPRFVFHSEARRNSENGRNCTTQPIPRRCAWSERVAANIHLVSHPPFQQKPIWFHFQEVVFYEICGFVELSWIGFSLLTFRVEFQRV